MPLYVILATEDVGYSETIDGRIYRPLLIDSDSHLQVDALSSALPTGAATEATLADIEAWLDALNGLLNALDSVGTDELRVNVISNILPAAPTSVESGKKVTAAAGTHVQLDTVTCKSVSVKALSTNTGLVYVGKDGVAAATGYQLAAGEAVELAIDNVDRIWIDSAVTGEGVTYLAVN